MGHLLALILLAAPSNATIGNDIAAGGSASSAAMSASGLCTCSVGSTMGTGDMLFEPATGADCLYDEQGATCSYRTDDSNAGNRTINAEDAWPFAADAKTAGDTIVRGGLDSKTFNVLDGLAGCDGTDTVTVVRIINGTSASNTLTYGTDFGTGAGLTATIVAEQLATAIEALSGVGATASGATCPSGAADARCVGVSADRLTSSITLSNNDNTCTVDSNGTDGNTRVDGNALWMSGAGGSGKLALGGTTVAGSTYLTGGGSYFNVNFGNTRGIGTSINSYAFGPVYISTVTIQTGGATKGQNLMLTVAVANCTFVGGGGGATCTTSAFIPFGATVVQISGRQTSPNTTCTTCTAGADMGPGLDADQYGTALECDVDNTAYTTATATADVMGTCLLAGGCTITMTAVGGNCVGGTAAWTAHYFTATGATLD